MKSFYEPNCEHLTKLALAWCASYSGGKDSTSLVTWIEWLRRAGWIDSERPALVMSDTGVEYPQLRGIANDLMDLLRRYGWHCEVVEPKIHERLYNRILGIGNMPVHPGITRMRWCTRATKIDPMDRWRRENDYGLTLTGLRLGESAMRDGKLKKRGCAAGGECGIPDPDERTFSPIINWQTCQVVEWLTGTVARKVALAMKDVLPITRRLIEVYDVRIDTGFDFTEPKVTAARFGCIGCPAIGAEREPPLSVIRRNGQGSPLNELYDVWFEARQRHNRCFSQKAKHNKGAACGYGPIKIAVRQLLFERVRDIEARSGVRLISAEDELFIRDCWARKVYPRGWSEADEATLAPSDTPLFVEESA